jgi:hypothetical protein
MWLWRNQYLELVLVRAAVVAEHPVPPHDDQRGSTAEAMLLVVLVKGPPVLAIGVHPMAHRHESPRPDQVRDLGRRQPAVARHAGRDQTLVGRHDMAHRQMHDRSMPGRARRDAAAFGTVDKRLPGRESTCN